MLKALGLIAAGLSVAIGAGANCEAPRSPDRNLDGGEATREEMQQSRDRLQSYLNDANTFLDCLDRLDALALRGGEESALSRRSRIGRYNRAMSDLTLSVNFYQDQVAQFNAR